MAEFPIRPNIFHRSPVAPAAAALAPSSVDPNIPVIYPYHPTLPIPFYQKDWAHV